MKLKFMSVIGVSILALAALGSGCNSGNLSNSCSDNPASCSAVTPANFVSALVSLAQSGQIASGYADSKIVKATSLQPNYFVIWNGETQTYEAVRLSQICDSGTHCSDSNPTAAAEGFANSANSSVRVGNWGSQNDVNVSNSPDAGIINFEPVLTTNRTDGGNEPIFQSASNGNIYYGVNAQTKDVDLQRAQEQNTALLERAAQISSGLQMDFKSAVQLTQLADRIQVLQSSESQLTDADRSAIARNLLSIAGVTQDEVNRAVQSGLSGDMSQTNSLLGKISQNLGMPQATLRDQILPKLGVNLN